MRFPLTPIVAVLLLAPAAGVAQLWEVDALAGAGAYRSLDIANRFGRATVGFTSGAMFGASLLQHRYRLVSGEIRYVFQRSDLKVASGADVVKFRGSTHALHYDWLFHVRPREAWVRPFFAAGAGFKNYRGRGTEQAYQPLSQFVLLTRTDEWKPLLTLGAGVRFRLGGPVWLAAEFRDYLTPFPQQVIAPVAGASLDRWLHDLVPSLGLGLRF
jgi:hypothetical protein